MVEEDIEITTFDGETITKSEYRDKIINMYVEASYEGLTKITDFTVGSEAYHLADIMASLMLEQRENTDNNYKMGMIHFAAGEFLDNFGDVAGIHRIAASPSTGEVVFTLKEAKTEDITIPDGTVVATDDAISFILDDNVVIAAGELTGSGEVFCEQEGEYTNVLKNTVNIIVTDLGIPGLTVTNPEMMAGGQDLEDDDIFRNRILQAPFNVPCGTREWYKNVIMSNESCNMTVHSVKVMKNVPGQDGDITIFFKPIEENDMVERPDINPVSPYLVPHAEADLYDLFTDPVYDVVGIVVDYVEASPVIVLPAFATESEKQVEYLYAIVLEDDYIIDDVKHPIADVIDNFNADSEISIEFTPDSLVSEIEENVEGVYRCRIVRHNITDDIYTEYSTQTNINDNQYYKVCLDNIADRIRESSFNINI